MNHRELWFILVANPDGYDFTFTPENRLWRKNLHYNDGDGQITAVDGVDPNRNFPNHWKWDDEGSNTDTSSETYRGTAPASEPETRAFLSLTDRVHFAWNKTTTPSARSSSGPSAGQIDTHPADEPLMTALAGNDAKPGIPGFDPDVAADLYTANGETNDQLYSSYGTISYTVEGTPGEGTGSGFIFPDDEAQVQADFEKHVQIALDLARSAADPSRPKSHLGNSAPDFVIEHPFDTSFGNPQTVEVDARRDLGRISVSYRVNGRRTHRASTREWKGGKRCGDVGDYWYHRVRRVRLRRRGPQGAGPLGVLSHYDAVVWETGNDNITRPTATPGVTELAAHEVTMAVRDFVNEGGRVALAGVNAGRQYDLVEYPGGLHDRGLRRRPADHRRWPVQSALGRLPPVLPGVVRPAATAAA